MTISNGNESQKIGVRTPFPVARLGYAVAFGVLAWFAFCLIMALAALQFVVLLATGRLNEELKSFGLGMVQYLWELLAFIAFGRDDKPFPFGPFPKI